MIDGIKKGMYLLEDGVKKSKQAVQLFGSGSILQEVRAAAEMLRNDYKVEVDVWAVTSYNELTRDGLEVDRQNLLHPEVLFSLLFCQKCSQHSRIPPKRTFLFFAMQCATCSSCVGTIGGRSNFIVWSHFSISKFPSKAG